MKILKTKNTLMTEGPLFGQMLKFAIPIILTGIIQLLFNATDLIVVGRYAENGQLAIGAVGACSSIIHLIVNFAMGLSLGVGVAIAHAIGSGFVNRPHNLVHTAISFGTILGLSIGFIGFVFSKPLLVLMNTPENVLDEAVSYMRADFVGVPAYILYNYLAAAIRSEGDSKRPLIFLSVSGLANVALNLVFVLIFKMGAEGVGIATAISQYIALLLMLIHMLKYDGLCKIKLSDIRISPDALRQIIRIGIPSCVQSILFSFSNVIIQSSVNSYGDVVVSGNASAANIEGFVYTAMNAVAQAVIVYSGQNMGAAKFKRLDRVLGCGILISTLWWSILTSLILIFKSPLLNFYTPGETEVIAAGAKRISVICTLYFIAGIMESISFFLKGIGKQIAPTIIVLIGTCFMRILWVYALNVFFPTAYLNPENIIYLYMSYPVTWTLAIIANTIYYLSIKKKLRSITV